MSDAKSWRRWHILLGAGGVLWPAPLYAAVSPWLATGWLAAYALAMLVLLTHGERAVGALAGLGIAALLAASGGALALLDPHPIVVVPCAFCVVATLAWLREYDQNAGHWHGQDVPDLHNWWKGAGIGAGLSLVVLGVLT